MTAELTEMVMELAMELPSALAMAKLMWLGSSKQTGLAKQMGMPKELVKGLGRVMGLAI